MIALFWNIKSVHFYVNRSVCRKQGSASVGFKESGSRNASGRVRSKGPANSSESKSRSQFEATVGGEYCSRNCFVLIIMIFTESSKLTSKCYTVQYTAQLLLITLSVQCSF